ncbi:recombinase RecT [Halonatronum saccharophilum]|uniref:recombinase RecT n=1 Tax=Halonatronum saccharophilum TaxID=150060 RepID=UPI00048214BD|nr:RecT family recombinase [Halonatronum saccharophilum]
MSNLAMIKKDTVDVVTERVRDFQQNGELQLPPNYSPENAMKSAWLKLQSTKDKNGKPVLKSCSQDSIANSLLDMVVQGLNPAKDQCYFVAYGKTLVLMRSYFGTMAVVKQSAGAEDVDAQVIFEGDDFKYEINHGRIKILNHTQSFTSRVKGNILGAYAVISFKDERPDYVELMTINQIKQAWSQGKTYREGGNGTHQKFEEEMCRKTIINRACKRYINSSNDSGLLADSFNRANEVEKEQEVQQEIEENANGEFIDVDIKDSPEPDPEPTPDNSNSEVIQEREQTSMARPDF